MPVAKEPIWVQSRGTHKVTIEARRLHAPVRLRITDPDGSTRSTQMALWEALDASADYVSLGYSVAIERAPDA